MKLTALTPIFCIVRLAPDARIPAWATGGSFYSLTQTKDELSIVCEQAHVPADVEKAERDWRCLNLEGPIPFGVTGVVAGLSKPLAEAGIGIFIVSTYDTDYLLVKSAEFARAVSTLRAAGYEVAE
ncbi:MAG: ACT domain-containing protein [Acidobacteriales bacterium]|nr:ACT domain-containing protein [Terriglobales bacterium]